MRINIRTTMAAALVAFPVSASAYEATNGTQVVEGLAGSFEVLAGSDSLDATSFWCGAGDYVILENLDPDDTLIYVLVPLGDSTSNPGVRSVVFTTQPTDSLKSEAVNDAEFEASIIGGNVTAFAAKDQCAGN